LNSSYKFDTIDRLYIVYLQLYLHEFSFFRQSKYFLTVIAENLCKRAFVIYSSSRFFPLSTFSICANKRPTFYSVTRSNEKFCSFVCSQQCNTIHGQFVLFLEYFLQSSLHTIFPIQLKDYEIQSKVLFVRKKTGFLFRLHHCPMIHSMFTERRISKHTVASFRYRKQPGKNLNDMLKVMLFS